MELIVGRAELGGCSLERHWGIMEAYENDSDDPKGKSYKGKSFQERFAEEQWDFVTIQQYSKHSTDPDTYRPYAQKIYNLIKRLQPQAEVLMHQTWAYRSDSKDWGRISATEDTKSEAEMYKKSREAYHTIANELGIRILPVGDAFWVAGQHRKFKFQGDDKFTYETPPDIRCTQVISGEGRKAKNSALIHTMRTTQENFLVRSCGTALCLKHHRRKCSLFPKAWIPTSRST